MLRTLALRGAVSAALLLGGVASAAAQADGEEEVPPPPPAEEHEEPEETQQDAASDEEDDDAEEEDDWFDQLRPRVFVDGYLAADWTLPNPFEGDHSAELPERAYDVNGGPNLAFLGFDLSYAPNPIGVTLNLRFGAAVPRLLGPFSGLPEGLQFVKQAFASWRGSSRSCRSTSARSTRSTAPRSRRAGSTPRTRAARSTTSCSPSITRASGSSSRRPSGSR